MGKKPAPKNSFQYVHFLVLLLGILLLVAVFKTHFAQLSSLQTPARPPSQSPLQKVDSLIGFSILREWKPLGDGIGMELLVKNGASKQDVIALANYLRQKYSTSPRIWIDIFDDREAWSRRPDPKYPESEFVRHWLVAIRVPHKTMGGKQEIEWLAPDSRTK